MPALLTGCSSSESPPAGPAPDPVELDAESGRRAAGIRALLKQDLYDQAEERARALMSDLGRRFGDSSVQLSMAGDLVVEALWRSGRGAAPETEALARRLVGIKERALGPFHLQVADSLSNLAIVLEDSRQSDEAEAVHRRIISLREQALGRDHPDVALAMVSLGNLYLNQGEYDKGRPLYERALGIQRRKIGSESPEVGRTTSNLAILLHESGEYAEAREQYERALRIREKIHGPDHPRVAWTLNGLAVLLEETGQYEDSERAYRRSLAIRRAKLPPEHLHIAWSLNNLANLHRTLGDYREARSLYEESLAIKVKNLGRDSADVALALNNLGQLAHMMGDLEAARTHYEEALSLREKAFEPDRQEVARLKEKLASLYADQGRIPEALELLEDALEIWSRKVGKDHLRYAGALAASAGVLARAGEHGKAARRYQEAFSIQSGIDPGHPDAGESMVGLARLASGDGDADRAMDCLQRALRIRERRLGDSHPLVAQAQSELGVLKARAGESPESLRLAFRAERAGRRHFRLTALTLTERHALEYATVRSSGLDLALTLEAERREEGSTARVWTEVIRSRALVLDEMLTRRRLLALRKDPDLSRLAGDLVEAARRLSNIVLRGPDPEDPGHYREILDHARARKESAERALARAGADLRPGTGSSATDLQRLAGALPPGTALLGYVAYEHLDLRSGVPLQTAGPSGRRAAARSSRGHDQASTSSILAFVLAAGGSRPVSVPLGSADRIGELISRWRQMVSAPGPTAAEAEAAYREAGAELRRAVWDPVAPLLGDAEQVLIVPDGDLSLVSFASLPAGEAGYLIESGPTVHYLTSEREIEAAASRPPRGVGLLALGGPAYDMDVGESAISGTAASRGASCASFRSHRFADLPATLLETERLAAFWTGGSGARAASGPVRRLVGASATEAAFKAQAPGKRILHIATHGFFLGRQCVASAPGRRGIGLVGTHAPGGTPSGVSLDPLHFSGLALAGANTRVRAPSDGENGILTAAEVSTLDLSGVEWAVLSACDTGIGEVLDGEGVLGLRRAFQTAGAGTVIMSLWPVLDDPARRWMEELYRVRFLEERSTAASTRAAGLAVLQQQRGRGESTHPYYWAAFVATGSWS